MKKTFVTLFSAALLLSACGSTVQPPAQSLSPSSSSAPSSDTAAGTAAPVKQEAAAAPSPAEQAVQKPAAEQTPAPVPSPAQAATEIKKEYKMNKNYDIVPIDASGNKKVVLLTFDDGPKEKELLDSLFDTLDKHKAKAIFFMNGYRIKSHPELLKLVDERGGILGNHSYDHIDLKKQTNEKVDQQLDDVNKLMKDIVGKTPQFFRPPFGSGSDYVKEKAKKEHMLYMTWSNGSLDWEMTNAKNDPKAVVKNVLDQLHAGSNILMHELPWTAQALDQLLAQLEEKGYSFVDPRAIEVDVQ
ncbi:polysaccharide deacetylase family protein [Paenibacillus chartarius]|uniref:Polysaccharide deacetylase family protein n=1 Tax=Paenibacillus chartarius TaxID=747481 RepID=A0ABV6DQF4_9BACL